MHNSMWSEPWYDHELSISVISDENKTYYELLWMFKESVEYHMHVHNVVRFDTASLRFASNRSKLIIR